MKVSLSFNGMAGLLSVFEGSTMKGQIMAVDDKLSYSALSS